MPIPHTPSAANLTSPEAVPVQFDVAFNRGDVDGLLALLDEAATMRLAPDHIIENDRPGVRAFLAQQLAAHPHISSQVRRVLRSEDLALVLVDWTITVPGGPAGQEHVNHGTSTQVMKQQADGSWRLKISNPFGVA